MPRPLSIAFLLILVLYTTSTNGFILNMAVFDRKALALPKLNVPEQFKTLSGSGGGIGVALKPGFLTSALASSVRLKTGSKTLDPDILRKNKPANLKPLVIYEYEASAPCRLVREACCILDLVVEYRPCPNERSGFSDLMATRTLGQRSVPFMIDDNSRMVKQEIFKADRIIEYLFDTYGGGKENIPPSLKGDNALLSSKLASALRGNSGGRVVSEAREENQFRKPIDLWGIEGDESCRPVREALNALSLAHRMIYTAEGSPNRALLEKRTGKYSVPYIEDPNTNIKLFDSNTIVKYLYAVYTVQKGEEVKSIFQSK